MPAPFKKLTREQFATLLDHIELKRKINAVHMHHTWKPTHADFRGHGTIVAMWHHHTSVNGWSDIAQHISIDPHGEIWLGRDWNLPPASASGHNGNGSAGPFMFEIIGNFDEGHDRLQGEQRKTVIGVIAHVQQRFGLAPETLVFHNAMSEKTCPGSHVAYADIIDEVKAAHDEIKAVSKKGHQQSRATGGKEQRKRPFSDDAIETELNQDVRDCIELMSRLTRGKLDPADAELSESDEAGMEYGTPQAGTARDAGLTPAVLAALRPHLVNLTLGKFSSEGEHKTTRGDVDAIFEQHLPAALANLPKTEKLCLLFYAHGGLISESAGLVIAHKHVDWWRANGVYPIYFIWETGFFETIFELLSRSRTRTARALARDVFDYTTDPLIEAAARALRGPSIWGGMKASAQAASGADGGARYVASRLKEFCGKHRGRVELHAVGHSAGSIFHAHFLSAALELGVPPFKSLQLLAPAIRADLFKRLLSPHVGKGIERATLFTMKKDYEQDDNCYIYRKSLLYLIYHALEPERETDILGLEISLRADPELRQLFGLTDSADNAGEVIWSISPANVGCSASISTTHGGFDDDAPTMNSVLRRVLGKADADALAKEYVVDGTRVFRSWEDEVDWPEALAPATTPAISPPTAVATPARTAANGAGTGRRTALCAGIDRYRGMPLAGCVADARAWSAAFIRLGFQSRLLLDGEATRSAILGELTRMIAESAPGDVLAFQFSGHGTELPDVDGDEETAKDQAYIPFDFETGAYVIDDDVREVLDRIPAGVNVTCFFDCCHSGSITRLAVGAASPANGGIDRRRRFFPATPEMIVAHKSYRSALPAHRAPAPGGVEQMRNICFSACRSYEVAYESNGQGDFTVRALQALEGGLGMTHQQFMDKVLAAFGQEPQQHANFEPSRVGAALLLAPLAGYADGMSVGAVHPQPAAAAQPSAAQITAMLQTLQTLIQQVNHA